MTPFYHTRGLPDSHGIYCITCAANGKIYIGSAINLKMRWKEHCHRLNQRDHPNRHLQNAFNKYGRDAFTFDVLELVLVPEMLTAREQYYFETLKPFGKRGFNIALTAGSSLGLRHTPETLAKLKDGRTTQIVSPETRAKLSASLIGNQHLLGHKHSQETREKMRKSQTGKTHTPETIEKMRASALARPPCSPETCQKISAWHTGRPAPNRGKKMSPEFHEQNVRTHAHMRKSLIVTAPDGTEYVVHGIRQFCETHNLHRSALRLIALGKQSNHKGWKARYPGT